MPKNFRKIPAHINERIGTFELDDVVVACAKLIRPDSLADYEHLGIRVEDEELVLPGPKVPNPQAGKYSLANVEGKEIVRRDQPKIQKEFCFLAPSWGDWGKGSHLVCHTREVYRRDFIPPKELQLEITLVEQRGNAYLVKFEINQVLSRRSPDFASELLYNLNILQENINAVDVFPSEATLAEYAETIQVDWELLPVGDLELDDVVDRITRQRNRRVTDEQRSTVRERLANFRRLRPTHFITGTSGFSRYFGAMYSDDFVVFENLRHGNALYVMYEDWEQLTQRSRIDLLKSDRDGFDRIIHNDGWERRLEALLQRYNQLH